MITSKNTQLFRLTNEELYQLSYQTVSLMKTDAAEFAKYGVDQAAIDELKSLSDSFNFRDFDLKYVMVQKAATEQKENLAEELRLMIYHLGLQVDLLWRKSSLNFAHLKLGNISQDNDYELSAKAKASVNVLSSYSELQPVADLLTELNAKNNEFRKLLDETREKKTNRYLATQSRIALGNQLFVEVRTYRELGRKMWATQDYVRSQAYLMPNKHKPGDSGGETEDPVVTTTEQTEA